MNTRSISLPSASKIIYGLRGAVAIALFAAIAMLPATATSAPASECKGIALNSTDFAALERDLGLSPEQACERLVAEKEANRIAREMREALGAAFGGAWFDDEALQLVVATTNAKAFGMIRAAGAQPKLVERSLKQLEAIKEQLDSASSFNGVSPFIWSWYSDVKANDVVVVIEPDNPAALDAAVDFIAASGADAEAIRIEESTTERPRLFYNVRGGDKFTNITQGKICSVGFSVFKGSDDGYATAGHCGNSGNLVNSYNDVAQGQFAGSIFPDKDMAWVKVNSNWDLTATVCPDNRVVNGSQEADVGESIFRCGYKTGGPR